MKKRILTALVLLVIASMMLFANGSAENTATAENSKELKGTLTIWSTLTQKERAQELENLGKKFEAENPGVTVEISVMPWSGALDKLMASIMAGNPPDIAVVGQGTPQTLAESGGLMELSSLVDKIGGADSFLGTSLSVLGSSTDGGVYAIPLYITPVVAYYRESYLEKAGFDKIPETWEEYYEMCKAVTDPANNIYGFGIPLGDHHGTKTIWSFLQGNGVDLVNVDANGNWFVDINDEDKAAMVEVYDYLYKLIRDCSPTGILSYTQANVRELVANGTIMSRIDTPEIYYNVKNMDPENISDVKYFRIPGRKTSKQYMGWVGFSVPTQGDTELASAFLEYAYSDDNMLDFYLSYPHAMFPAQKELFYAERYQANLPEELKPFVPDLAVDILSNSAAIALASGPFPFAGVIESKNMLGSGLTRMVTEGISATEAVEAVIKDIEALFR